MYFFIILTVSVAASVIICALCCTSSVFHSGSISKMTALPIMSDLSEPSPGRTSQQRELFSTQFTVRANWCSGLNLSIMGDGGRERIMRRQTQWERRGEERSTGRMMGWCRDVEGGGGTGEEYEKDRKQTDMKRKMEWTRLRRRKERKVIRSSKRQDQRIPKGIV